MLHLSFEMPLGSGTVRRRGACTLLVRHHFYDMYLIKVAHMCTQEVMPC